MKPDFPLFFLLVYLSITSAWAQDATKIYYEKKPEDVGNVSVCAWSNVSLYAEPGQGSEVLTSVLFGEELSHLGEEALVRRERNNYLLVEAKDGARGWIDDQYVVRHAGLVAMLENARVFNKPSSYATSSGLSFYAGELAILSDWQENWVYLTGEKGRVFGWVEGYERLSVDARDIEVSGMLRKALMITDPNDQMVALRSISQTPAYQASAIHNVVEKVIFQLTDPGVPINQPTSPTPGGDSFDPMPAPDDRDPNYQEITRYDESGQPFIQVRETGTVQPVKPQGAKTPYYAYHKTLPIGQTILLQVPGDQGYIELEVIARLRSTNKNVVGLGAEVIQKVYGVARGAEVPSATILYVKP
jgi:hypothetical protein